MKARRQSSPASRTETSRRRRRRWFGAILILMLAAGFIVVEKTTDFDWRAIPQMLGSLPTAAVLPLVAILPLFGFPISIVYLVLGARFGPYIGLAIVAGISAIHVAGTYWISNSFLQNAIRRWLAKRHHRVPEVPAGEEASIVVIAVLAPVLPYFLRNYALGLSGISLRILMLVAVPLYTLRSGVTLFLGDLSSEPSVRGFLILSAIYATKLGVCAWLVWRMREHHKSRRAAREAHSNKAMAA